MTTYTAIPNGDIDPESPVTTGLMTLLRDNPLAIAEGDATAPNIQAGAFEPGAIVNADISASAAIDSSKIASDNGITQGMLAPDSVGQSEIKTATQNVATGGYFIATGGAYVMGHDIQMGGGGAPSYALLERRTDDTGLNAEWNLSSDAGTPGADLHYVNSSPPYDLGDGEIPFFVYLCIDNGTGEVKSLSASPDPVWVYNGPTNCRPAGYDSGAPYQIKKDMSGFPFTLAEAVNRGPAAIEDYFYIMREAPAIKVEISQSRKNADMDIIPHAFPERPGETRVILDPVSTVLGTLAELQQHDTGSNEIARVLRDYLIIGNTPLERYGPADILIASVKWKKNKK